MSFDFDYIEYVVHRKASNIMHHGLESKNKLDTEI